MFLSLLTAQQEDDDDIDAAVVACLVAARGSVRTRHYLKRSALLPVSCSPWQRLFVCGDDSAFITTMSVDRASFFYIHSVFHRHYIVKRMKRGVLDSTAALGLTLHYLNSTMMCKTLCQVFGSTPSVTSRVLRKGLQTLSASLDELHEARIQYPTPAQMRDLSLLVERREPNLPHVFGFADGMNVKVSDARDPTTQNAFYNGWLHDSFVSAVLLFLPDGTIGWTKFNCPGSWHDSKIASDLYNLLLDPDSTPDPFRIISDTGFTRTKQLESKILTPLSETDRRVKNATLTYRDISMNRWVTSVRQAVEWGVGSVKSAFGRLRVPLPIHDTSFRLVLFRVILKMYNLRVRMVQVNQIRTVFSVGWGPSAQTEDYDRVAQFYQISV